MFIVDSDTPEGVIGQLRDAGKEISAAEASGRMPDPFDDDEEEGEGKNEGGNGNGSGALGPPFGIVLNGHSLVGLLLVQYVDLLDIHVVICTCGPKLRNYTYPD